MEDFETIIYQKDIFYIIAKKKMRNMENEQWNTDKTQIHSEGGSL